MKHIATRTLETAPEALKARLESLKKRGLLGDPEFKQAFVDAAQRFANEPAPHAPKPNGVV